MSRLLLNSATTSQRFATHIFALERQKQIKRLVSTTHFGYETVDERDKKERVRMVFANVATKYDLMNDAMSMGIHRLWKDYFVRQLKLSKDAKLLDMAGGTGDIAFRVLNRLKSEYPRGASSITVADINENMLEVGKLRASDNAIDQRSFSWVCADAEKLPFEDASFDFYTISFGIRNCTHLDKVLTEAHRVLKPNGTFACLEFGHVDNSLLARVYDAYSFQLIPVMGQLLVGDFKSYKYLVESIRMFPPQDQFAHIIRANGFREVSYENLSCGICSIFTGIK